MLALVGLVAHTGAGLAWAQGPYIYPQRGQSPEQQQRDRGDCHVWAVQNSGFDPTRQTGAPPPPPPQGGQVVGGAARGAAIGAVGGAIGGDAGKGAAIGAATGALVGGMRRRSQEQQYAAAANQQQAMQAEGMSTYNRALGACLEGRGYTVK